MTNARWPIEKFGVDLTKAIPFAEANINGVKTKTPSLIRLPVDEQALIPIILSPMEFGAVGDGDADDTGPINDCLDYIRQNINATYSVAPYIMRGGNRLYKASSLNATSITGAQGWGIEQFNLLSIADGFPAIDLIDSRFGTFKDIYVWGDSILQPYSGIQQGRKLAGGGPAAGTHYFENVGFDGYYLSGALQNNASEVCEYNKCKFWNRRDADGSGIAYAAIFDGAGLMPCVSKYVTPENSTAPFNLTRVSSSEFRKLGSNGPTIFVAEFSRLAIKDTYSVCNNAEHVTFYCTGSERDFTFEGHFEGAANNLVKFTGASAVARNVQGFKLQDHSPDVGVSVFAIDTITSVNLYDFDLRIRAFSPAPSTGIFDDETKYRVIGNIVVPTSTPVATENLIFFVGSYRNSISSDSLEANQLLQLHTYTVANLPSAAAYPRVIVYVSDGTSNKRLAVSDGTNWRFPDGAIVS